MSKTKHSDPPARRRQDNQGKTVPYRRASRTHPDGSAAKTQTHGHAGMDYSLIFIVLFLLVFGLVMLYSTSSYEAGADYGDSAYYLKRQCLFVVIGLAAMVVTARLPMELWKRFSLPIYLVSCFLMVLLIPFGTTANGATRWLYVGPVSVQPAEICKLGAILITALGLCRMPRRELRSWKGLLIILAPSLLQAVLIYMISSNLSSALIVVLIALAMAFVASEDIWRYVILALLVAAGGAGVIFMAVQAGSDGGFRLRRILAWLDPTAYSDSTALQTLQGLYGIGSGGVFGKGLGQSIQKLGYIPEAQNDMIFSIICEELGLFGAVSIIILFLILAWRMMIVAMYAGDLQQSLMVVGVMAHIVIQVILNIAVVTNTIPNTGVTLPFFSYGGSAIFMILVEVGLVLNVSRNSPAV